jgi:hypothetical protein
MTWSLDALITTLASTVVMGPPSRDMGHDPGISWSPLSLMLEHLPVFRSRLGLASAVQERLPGENPAESFVVGVVVVPDDMPVDHASCPWWVAWAGPSSAKYRSAVNWASMRFNQDAFAGV